MRKDILFHQKHTQKLKGFFNYSRRIAALIGGDFRIFE